PAGLPALVHVFVRLSGIASTNAASITHEAREQGRDELGRFLLELGEDRDRGRARISSRPCTVTGPASVPARSARESGEDGFRLLDEGPDDVAGRADVADEPGALAARGFAVVDVALVAGE